MWFKVDDKFPNHRKVRQVRRSHPTKRRDASAFGLWVLAGAWSDDGFVPLEVLEDWDDDAEAMALRLVDAGLWVSCRNEGEPGFRFHDWDEMNPDPATAGAMGNHRRWHERRGKSDPKCIFCVPDRGDIAPESPPISPPNPDADRVRIVSGIADPTRPDPTRPISSASRRVSAPKGWQPNEKHAAMAAANNIDAAAEAEKFLDHHGAKGSKFVDWDKAFNTWLRNAIQWAKPTEAAARPIVHQTITVDHDPNDIEGWAAAMREAERAAGRRAS